MEVEEAEEAGVTAPGLAAPLGTQQGPRALQTEAMAEEAMGATAKMTPGSMTPTSGGLSEFS